MSFRWRVFALIVVVAVTATAATAWLTLSIATRQAERSVSAGEQEIQRITAELTRFGHEYGSWKGVDVKANALAQQTGQRIRLATETGRVLVDTDGAAPVSGAPLAIDVRPILQLPRQLNPDGMANTHPGSGMKIAVTAVGRYHYQHRLRRCLIGAGITVTSFAGPHGIDEVVPATGSRKSEECKRSAELADKDYHRYQAQMDACMTLAEEALRDCLRNVFLQQIADVAPEPLRVYIGTSETVRSPVPVMPVAAATTVIALIAVLGSTLLSRHVLKPTYALTAAAERLGKGRLDDRVPAAGQDELAGLSQAFNRMAQALQDSEDRQRRMTADIAHELRSPLTNLRGYLEALTDGTVAPSRELFVSLREEALLQQRIIDDLQDLSLAEAGQLAYQRRPVDLTEVVRAFQQTGPVAVTAVAEQPIYVDGDADRLRQVVGNLVRNALQATPSGGHVMLSIRHSGQWAELVVADTGKGIGEQDLPHVFDRFWRADRARPRGSGSGLGLAIVRQIVTDHGGEISVSSVVGQGTTFVVKLPARHTASH